MAKISTGKDLYGALAYNQTKVENGHAKILDANLLPYPEDGRFRMGETMEAFTAWLPSHYRTEKPVIHISLNPHPDDVLTDGQLAAIGREYMEKLGVTRNFAASLFRNIKYFTLRKLYLCRKWMQKRLQKTTTTGITLPNFDFLA